MLVIIMLLQVVVVIEVLITEPTIVMSATLRVVLSQAPLRAELLVAVVATYTMA